MNVIRDIIADNIHDIIRDIIVDYIHDIIFDSTNASFLIALLLHVFSAPSVMSVMKKKKKYTAVLQHKPLARRRVYKTRRLYRIRCADVLCRQRTSNAVGQIAEVEKKM